MIKKLEPRSLGLQTVALPCSPVATAQMISMAHGEERAEVTEKQALYSDSKASAHWARLWGRGHHHTPATVLDSMSCNPEMTL